MICLQMKGQNFCQEVNNFSNNLRKFKINKSPSLIKKFPSVLSLKFALIDCEN